MAIAAAQPPPRGLPRALVPGPLSSAAASPPAGERSLPWQAAAPSAAPRPEVRASGRAVAAALVVAGSIGCSVAAGRRRRGRLLLRGARRAPATRAATATAPGPAPPSCFVDEYKDEEPTPFPKEKVIRDEVIHLITLLDEDNESPLTEDTLYDALEAVTDLHESDMNWIQHWPRTIAEVKDDPVSVALFKLVRCVLHIIENEGDDVRFAAIDLLHSLSFGGSVASQVDGLFVLECGAIPVLVEAAKETQDRKVFDLLTKLAKDVPVALLPNFFNANVIEAAKETLEDIDTLPMEQYAAMSVITTLCTKAPAWTARAGAYEVVAGISNEALLSRRNKILSLLRPIIFAEGDEAPLTNIHKGRPSW